MKTKVWIKTSFVGFHCWPRAPEEVRYLRDLHRHTFNVKVSAFVQHNDRELEFHTLKGLVDKVIGADVMAELTNSPHLSCEMISEAIFLAMRRRYDIVCASVAVDEDGECGSETDFT